MQPYKSLQPAYNQARSTPREGAIRLQKARADRKRFYRYILGIFTLVISIAWVGLGPLQSWLESGIAPVASSLRQVISPITTGLSQARLWVSGQADLVDQVHQLQLKNEALAQLKHTVVLQNGKLSQLEKLVQAVPGLNAADFISVRIGGFSPTGPWQRRPVDVGANQGLLNGQTVLDSQGLVGRLEKVRARDAVLVPITDPSSRVPVATDTGIQGIVAGDGGRLMRLAHVQDLKSLHVGEILHTSSAGGIFTAGLAVGRIAEIVGTTVKVEPIADLQNLAYVLVHK